MEPILGDGDLVNKQNTLQCDLNACADYIVQLMSDITDNAKQLDTVTLGTAGLLGDPQELPLNIWLSHLLQHVTETEALSACIYILKALRFLTASVSIRGVHQRLRPHPQLAIHNRHRVILAAMILAQKYYRDYGCYSLRTWSRVVYDLWTPQELMTFEIRMLQCLNWSVFIRPEDYAIFIEEAQAYRNSKRKRVSMIQPKGDRVR
eukprot:TRINITY_DN20768_c0_g1::TRINITY_DN20768_c0_g1_i1::g.10786::m.10786 TRINITY_DN20768_c0_g1::TRINITY_DN20768_c0_g1_i1::g.10786  ORF type:complete len:206 (+),score=6.82,Cyclin/PF08613.6/0.00015,Cyclin_N/PF00134.18/0.0002 TRINITY_DN20768_c0_g1_i1:93-710(+)